MFRVKPITPSMLARVIFNAPEIQYLKACCYRGLTTVYHKGSNIPNMTNMDFVKALWLFLHLACSFGFLVSLWRRNTFWYYVLIGGAISLYTVSLFRHILEMIHGTGAARDEMPLALILNAENSLLLVTAWLHVTLRPNPLKLCLFAIFSYMNVISFLLHELISANSFTTALFPVLSCVEPLLLGFACLVDYCVLLMYYHEWFTGQTPLMYALIFSYISFKRLEKSELARASLYSLFDMTHALLVRLHSPFFVLRVFRAYQRVVCFLVPLNCQTELDAVTRRASMKTRATSIFFEPILIINDLN